LYTSNSGKACNDTDPNCKECKNGQCIRCDQTYSSRPYELKNGKCIKKRWHTDIYCDDYSVEDDGKCEKCVTGYKWIALFSGDTKGACLRVT
jgi:hypothetical protein